MVRREQKICRSKSFLPYFTPNHLPTIEPVVATTGAAINNSSAGNWFPPNKIAPVDDAAIPAIKRSESPGKAKPINKPVSANRIANIPIKPRSETIDWASNKFIT